MVAVYQFDGAIRDAVHALKYDGLRAIAPALGRLMASHPSLSRMDLDAIVAVPVHPRRLRERGYNQAGLLADEVGRRLSLPVAQRALRRVKDTPPQARTKDEAGRARNVAGVFEAGTGTEGKRLLLVDDVATTGSTVNACAAALRRAGAEWVGALVLAREM